MAKKELSAWGCGTITSSRAANAMIVQGEIPCQGFWVRHEAGPQEPSSCNLFPDQSDFQEVIN